MSRKVWMKISSDIVAGKFSSWLDSALTFCSFFQLPIQLGKCLSLLPSTKNVTMLTRFFIESGSCVSWFRFRCSTVRLTSEPVSRGT